MGENAMKNLLKEKILSGTKGIGTFFEIGGANAVECLGAAGLDFFIIDSEHGPFEPESAADLVRAASLRGITPLARIKDSTRASALKMLDIGVQGLVVPCVESVQEVRDLVGYAKYFPVGNRGVMWGRDALWGAAEYAAAGLSSYFDRCNGETLLIPQCETAGCLANIEEIAALDGVDGIFLGPFDLSVALNNPGAFDTEEFKNAVARVLKACKDVGKFAMTFAADAEAARTYFEQGFDAAAVALDTVFYINAFKRLIREVREG